MAQFKHPKIVSLLGVVTATEPFMICMEFMQFGSLEHYLQRGDAKKDHSDLDFIRMACDVCSAMHYLGQIGFIHRDLAVRNVLINQFFVCKVADFGLSIEVGEDASHVGERIPIRWTAPEAVKYHQFSVSSDVWSYGIVLWEMWSYGAVPYKGWSNEKVTEQTSADYRLPAPKLCPDAVHTIMLKCWAASPSARPSFRSVFEDLLSAYDECEKGSAGVREPAQLQSVSGAFVIDNVLTLVEPWR
jgi:serine/threonine protein kinase